MYDTNSAAVGFGAHLSAQSFTPDRVWNLVRGEKR
jgi:hypothetical protein